MKQDDLCPICEDGQQAHFCENCSKYVCQGCFNFDSEFCIECKDIEEI